MTDRQLDWLLLFMLTVLVLAGTGCLITLLLFAKRLMM